MSKGYPSRAAAFSAHARIKRSVRIFCVKSGSDPLARLESEYSIPLADDEALLAKSCGQSIGGKTSDINRTASPDFRQ